MVGGFHDTDIRDKKKLHCLKSIKYSSLRVVKGNKVVSSKIPTSIMFWNNEKHFVPPKASKKETAMQFVHGCNIKCDITSFATNNKSICVYKPTCA